MLIISSVPQKVSFTLYCYNKTTHGSKHMCIYKPLAGRPVLPTGEGNCLWAWHGTVHDMMVVHVYVIGFVHEHGWYCL
jgi:hypothetical protein